MKKVIFNLTEEQDARLGKLAKHMGVTKSEALRRSIELYHFFKEAQQEGSKFKRLDKDGVESFVEIIG